MTLELWASNRWLERLESDGAEIERLFLIADGHLSDYQKAVASGISSDTQLSLAYDCRFAGQRLSRGTRRRK
jgi:hypothetical protein